MKFTIPSLFSLSLLLLGLTACEGQNARDILGLDRRAPDEFRVVSRPPLSTPPDFQLRPPLNGDPTTGLPPADLQAKSLVIDGRDISDVDYDVRRQMGGANTAVGVVSSFETDNKADNALLNRAGATNASGTIRDQIYQERVNEAEQKSSEWLFPQTSGDAIVDAEKEKARLKAAAEQGQPVTAGETPVIEPKQRGILENIF